MKKIIWILMVVCFTLIIGVILFFNIKEKEKIKQEQYILDDIKSHYNTYVVTLKDTDLYKLEDDKYIKIGRVNENVKLTLLDENITLDTKYFEISNLNLYISYKDVKPIEEYTKSDRYKYYIPFNKNIITNDVTNFYNEENELVYTINSSYEFPIILSDEDRYGIEFDNELLYVKNSDVCEIIDSPNTDLKNKSRIRTLTYHFLYDSSTTVCDQAICQSLEQFESHLKYLKENDYFTLKLNELELYLDGKINIRENSVVLTVDDGTTFDVGAIKLLEEYDFNATLFVITGWVDPSQFISDNLDLESHTDSMHNQYECPAYGNQGGGILCLPEEEVLSDLALSQEKLNGSKYFAYPFFDFNDRAINLLKEAGFKLAFIGQYNSDGYSYPFITDKYKVPRKTIFSSTTMEEFISYVN